MSILAVCELIESLSLAYTHATHSHTHTHTYARTNIHTHTHTSNRYSPHVNSSRHTVSTRSSAHSAYHSPQHSSTLTEDAASSVTPHTGSSFLDIPNSPAGGGGLSAGAPPTFGANESPWSFIQSVAKSKERHVNERERERGRREGRDSSHANKLKTSNSHRRHHHRYHSHPTSYLHRWHHNSQKRRFSNPLNKVNYIVLFGFRMHYIITL